MSSRGRGRPRWGQGEPAGPESDLSGALVRVGISRGGPTPALSGASLQDSGGSVLVKREPYPE